MQLAREHRVKKILITHVEAPFVAMPVEQQKALARCGCLFERTWVFTTPALGCVLSPDFVIGQMKEVGYESAVLPTDMGQVGNPSSVDGFREFVQACSAAGISDAEIRRMGRDNISAWLP